MKNSRNMAFAIGLLLAAGLALAQTVSQDDFTRDKVAGFKGDDKSLTNAVGAIEAATSGRVIEIRFATQQGEPGYHAVIARGGEVAFVHIQEKSRNVVDIDADSSPTWMLKWRGQAIVKAGEKARVSLSDAIRAAEKAAYGAPAVAAGLAPSAGGEESRVVAYNVLLYKDGQIQRKAVDSDDGMIIEDPSALSDD